jgi:alcohol dehydrogenase, propanol-preferring
MRDWLRSWKSASRSGLTRSKAKTRRTAGNGKGNLMKAAVFHGPEKGLKFEEIPVPQVGPDQVLVKVAACGVCHTDLHYIEHGVPTFKKPPIVLGHEASGTVEDLGPGVTNVKKGQRVLIPAVLTCGRCPLCRQGRENICADMKMLGNHFDGAYAEFVAVPSKDLLNLPDSIALQDASIIADALSTPYHAVKNRARVQPGDTVVVFGCGGVGINAVQLAALAGGYVIAVDISERKLEWAAQFGAAKTVNASKVDKVSKEIKKLTGGGADIAMEVIGSPRTFEEALESVRVGGRVVAVGYTSESSQIVSGKIMFKELEVVGSLGCRPVDYVPLIRMVEQGRIDLSKLVTHRFPLAEIGKAFEAMHEGVSLRSIVIP